MTKDARRIAGLAAAVLALTTAAAAASGASDTIVTGKKPVLTAHRAPHPAPISLASDFSQDTALQRLPKPYGGTPIDVLTYHYDQGRTGWNQNETDLTPAAVASSKFTQLAKLAVDGNMFAQPLLVANYAMPDGTVHDVLIVATGHNSVYAFDARTYTILWQRNMGTPQATADVGCSDVQPEYGISSTPVILKNANGIATIYLVAATETQPFALRTYIHALDLGSGTDTLPAPEIKPSADLVGWLSRSFRSAEPVEPCWPGWSKRSDLCQHRISLRQQRERHHRPGNSL